MKLFNRTNVLLTRSIGCAATLLLIGGVYCNADAQRTESYYKKATQQPDEVISYETLIIETSDIKYSSIQLAEADTVKSITESIPTYLMYVDGSSVFYRSQPVISKSTQIGLLERGEEVDVICQEGEWCKCVIDGQEVYIHATLLTDNKNATQIAEILDDVVPLNSEIGTVDGPSGKETYYNLNMKGCIKRMKSLGYDYDYWVRSDGVKMFGDYIMVAANFDIRPLGTIIDTSLGQGIVVDCGEFIYENPTQIDVAVTW